MEINYIILAHKNPDQLYRLITELNNEHCNFYIHIDLKVEICSFKDKFQDFPNVFFLKNGLREKGTWGDIGIVIGTLAAMQQIMEHNRKGYCVLMSGQDYPLKNNKEILNFFTNNYGKHFISLFKLPHVAWENGGEHRINQYKINKTDKRGDFVLVPTIWNRNFYTLKNFKNLLLLKKEKKNISFFKIIKKRKIPHKLSAYGGGQWWALPIESIKKILLFVKEHPEYLEYHKYTLLPDEIFFHSILKYLATAEDLEIEPSLTYVNWKRNNEPLPVTFKSADFDELKEASKTKLFARKFDEEVDATILIEIDKKLKK